MQEITLAWYSFGDGKRTHHTTSSPNNVSRATCFLPKTLGFAINVSVQADVGLVRENKPSNKMLIVDFLKKPLAELCPSCKLSWLQLLTSLNFERMKV